MNKTFKNKIMKKYTYFSNNQNNISESILYLIGIIYLFDLIFNSINLYSLYYVNIFF